MAADSGDHGSLFPLLRPLEEGGDRRGVPRHLARRRRKREVVDRLLEGAVASLNALAAARGNGRLGLRPVRHASSEVEITRTRDAVLNNLARTIKLSLPMSGWSFV